MAKLDPNADPISEAELRDELAWLLNGDDPDVDAVVATIGLLREIAADRHEEGDKLQQLYDRRLAAMSDDELDALEAGVEAQAVKHQAHADDLRAGQGPMAQADAGAGSTGPAIVAQRFAAVIAAARKP